MPLKKVLIYFALLFLSVPVSFAASMLTAAVAAGLGLPLGGGTYGFLSLPIFAAICGILTEKIASKYGG